MYSKIKFFRSIPFKVSFFYTLAFTFVFMGIFVIVYYFLSAYLEEAEENWLVGEAKQLQQLLENSSMETLTNSMKKNAQIMGTHQVLYCLWNNSGQILSHSDIGNWEPVTHLKDYFPWHEEKFIIETQAIPGKHLHFRSIYFPMDKDHILQVVYSLKNSEQFLTHFRRYFAYAAPSIILIFWLLGYFMIRSIVAPIHTMTNIAQKVSRENLEQRVPVHNKNDEIDNLAITLNRMLDRIALLVHNIQEMCENLAHDIRTPITRMRGAAEVALLKDRSEEDYKEVLQDSLDECERLLQLLNTLLDISEVEAGIITIPKKILEINSFLEQIVEMFEPLAQQKNIELLYTPSETECFVYGNDKHLHQALINLIDNAIKYTEKGKVHIFSQQKSPYAIVSIQDTGIGIKENEHKRIFDRFYRSDASRSLPGSGLGLSLTKAVVRAHNGKIVIKSRFGHGSIFSIYLKKSSV